MNKLNLFFPAALASGLLVITPTFAATKPAAKPAAKPAVKPAARPAVKPAVRPAAARQPANSTAPDATVKAFLEAQKEGDDEKAHSLFSTAAKAKKPYKQWSDQGHQVRMSFSAIPLIAAEAFIYGGGENLQTTVKTLNVEGNTATVEVTRLLPIKNTLHLTKENGKWVIDIHRSLLDQEPEPAKTATVPPPPPQLETPAPPPKPDYGASCRSNLRAVGTAFMVYALDHGGRLPDASNWLDEITPYLTSPIMLKCPPDSTAESNYAMNEALSGKLLSEIENQDNRVLLYETTTTNKNAKGSGQTLPNEPQHKDGFLVLLANGQPSFVKVKPEVR